MRPGVAKLEREAALQQPVLVGEASKQAFEGDALLETLGRDPSCRDVFRRRASSLSRNPDGVVPRSGRGTA